MEAAIPEAWNKRTTGGNERAEKSRASAAKEGGYVYRL